MISETHAERRQDQDVDLGMAEEPEQVLPQHGRAAVLRVEEMCAQVAIEQDHDLRRRQRRKREQNHETTSQHHPDEEAACASTSCPDSACARMVAMKLTAAAMVPTPLTSRPRIQ